jgi:hypothetical protein
LFVAQDKKIPGSALAPHPQEKKNGAHVTWLPSDIYLWDRKIYTSYFHMFLNEKF